jgi:peptidyl-prolyl cis-trans isomerase B (cyclophilin B)
VAALVTGTALVAQQPKAPAKTSAAPAKSAPAKAPAAGAGPVLVFETVKGNFEIETYTDDCPKSAEHIIGLVRSGFYRGLRMHWVTNGTVQFGDPFTKDMTKKDMWGTGGSGKPVGVAETSKRKFERGIVGLAYRTDYNPRTADSQIFVAKGPNALINGKYAVIGHVTDGMAIVDKLEVPDVIKNAYVKAEKK